MPRRTNASPASTRMVGRMVGLCGCECGAHPIFVGQREDDSVAPIPAKSFLVVTHHALTFGAGALDRPNGRGVALIREQLDTLKPHVWKRRGRAHVSIRTRIPGRDTS